MSGGSASMWMTSRVENQCHTTNQSYQEDSRRQDTELLHQRSTSWVLWTQTAHTAALSLPVLHIWLFLLFRRYCRRNAVPETIEGLLVGIRLGKAVQICYELSICSIAFLELAYPFNLPVYFFRGKKLILVGHLSCSSPLRR